MQKRLLIDQAKGDVMDLATRALTSAYGSEAGLVSYWSTIASLSLSSGYEMMVKLKGQAAADEWMAGVFAEFSRDVGEQIRQDVALRMTRVDPAP